MIEKLFKGFITLFVVCVFIFMSFWIIKNASYYLWYEDLVLKTIQETVKAESLK